MGCGPETKIIIRHLLILRGNIQYPADTTKGENFVGMKCHGLGSHTLGTQDPVHMPAMNSLCCRLVSNDNIDLFKLSNLSS